MVRKVRTEFYGQDGPSHCKSSRYRDDEPDTTCARASDCVPTLASSSFDHLWHHGYLDIPSDSSSITCHESVVSFILIMDRRSTVFVSQSTGWRVQRPGPGRNEDFARDEDPSSCTYVNVGDSAISSCSS